MSEENVELARRAYEAWNRGDVDGVLALCHPELEYHASGIYPGLDAVYEGHEGFRKFERDFRATWATPTGNGIRRWRRSDKTPRAARRRSDGPPALRPRQPSLPAG